MRCLLIFLLLSASSCETTGPLRGSGEIAPAPGGYTTGCQNNPDAVACPK